MESLTIGQVAKQAGIGIETVRFYERTGLLEEPPRRESGYRQYPVDAVPRLRFIRQAKALGFSLKEIKDLLSLRVDRHRSKADVRRRAQAKLAEIERKMTELARMKRSLEQLMHACRGPTRCCPILEAMASHEGQR